MSVDLDVKVLHALSSADVTVLFKQVMVSLLNIQNDFHLESSILDHGEWQYHDVTLAPEGKKLRLHIPPDGFVDVMLFCPLEDIGDMTIYASISAQGKDSALRAAMLGGCAVAISRMANSPILDHYNSFFGNIEYTADELSEILRCRHPHDTVEQAAQEVLENISRTKSGKTNQNAR